MLIPPLPKISLRRNIIIGSLVAVALIIFYFIADPATSRIMPKCIFHSVTGLDCPGCGSQRLIHALLHGDLAAAFRANALLFIMLPVIPAMVWLEFTRNRHLRIYRAIHSRLSLIIISSVIIAWTVIRNLNIF